VFFAQRIRYNRGVDIAACSVWGFQVVKPT
jgi:hypothetical protein